jgi:hypothetical protein
MIYYSDCKWVTSIIKKVIAAPNMAVPIRGRVDLTRLSGEEGANTIRHIPARLRAIKIMVILDRLIFILFYSFIIIHFRMYVNKLKKRIIFSSLA